jgi:hypothetical protein
MRLRHLILFAVALATSLPAAAQFGGSRRGASGGGAERGGGMARDSARSDATRMNADDQFRMQLTDIQLALKLAPEQRPAWQAYERIVLDLLSDLRRGSPASEPGQGAPQQIERKVDVVRNRLAAMEDLSAAAKKFYAVLTDEQKVVADRLLAGTVPSLYPGARQP